MESRQLFGAKVEIKTLLVTDQPAGRVDVQARLLSPGGELAVLADGLSSIRHLAYVELREGKPRGNHFHSRRHESFYLIKGELDLHVKDRSTGEKGDIRMRAGDLARISPEIVHTFVPLTAGDAIEFASEVFDASDVYRDILV
jgi:mannose-6-phosphate isomerase-like protein (cupin superfamily)